MGAPCSPPGRAESAPLYDGRKRRKGSNVHIAVDTLGHLPALKVTPADEQERARIGALAAQVQAAADQQVQIGYIGQD
jgi:hypothetical protein